MELLEVINESGDVLRTEDREVIHRDGLLHKEVHVWLYTPAGQVILQHRAKDKDTWPDLLDTAVGGHVEIGDSYLETVIKEMEEETGLATDKEKLTDLGVEQLSFFDERTDTTNNVCDAQYLYCFDQDIASLQVEAGKALGFKVFSIIELQMLVEKQPELFTDHITNHRGQRTIARIIELVQ